MLDYTSIPYAADIKNQIQQAKTILRLMDSENDPLPFPNMLGGPDGGAGCCSKHKADDPDFPQAEKTPATRLRELSTQLRSKLQQQECIGSQFKRNC